ncbi:pre-peptidase C-terminal domain-containing protein [Leptothermofonsia sp. ETS-13]|uniref:pre-peptidase C-terminal domain-containing protein n=1 Tax=Leptothermofonsia sp. ETS-13 TaxID=3035696 RepID=UPI003BA09A42
MEPFAKSTQFAFVDPVVTGPLERSKRSLLSPLSTDPLDARLSSSSHSGRFTAFNETATPPPIDGSLVQIQPLAQNLGSLIGQRQLSGSLNASNPYDVYRFDIPTTTGLTSVNLAGTGTNVITSEALVVLVEDRNNNGRVDAGEAFEGSSTSPVRRPYGPGTYYVVVYFTNGALDYTLTLETDFAGNTLATAANLGPLSARQSFQDAISINDGEDFYRFSVDTESDFTLLLDNLTADANVQLVQDLNNNRVVEDSEILQASANPGITAEAIARRLAPGTYFVRILPGAGVSTNYTLTLSFDQAGNALSSARSLDFLSEVQSFYDFLDSADPEDAYRFEVFTESNLSLLVEGFSDLASIQLVRDGNGNGIVEAEEILATSANLVGTRIATLGSSLAIGTCFIRVLPSTPAASATNYRLDILVTGADQAGNDLLSPRDIGLSSIATSFTDWVDGADPNDFYRFSLINTSTVNLTLDSLIADANLQLIQDLNENGIIDSNEILQTSANPGIAPEIINPLLGAGTYFVRVYPASGATNYRLTASMVSLMDLAGNNLNDARLVNLNGAATTFADQIGNSDLEDYYRFNIANDGSTLNLLLDGLTADTNAQLIQDLNSDGLVDSNEILDVAVGTGSTKILNRPLSAGTYFVRIVGTTPNISTDYTLSLSLDQAGNTPNLARPIQLNGTSNILSDWVSIADTVDYYQISLSTSTNLSLVLNGLSTDVNFRLLDSAGSLIQDSTRAEDGTRSLNRIELPGTYLIEISSLGGNTNYRLQVDAPPVDNAGNTLANALDLGSLRGNQTFSDFISNFDREEFYRFNVDAAGLLNVQLTNLVADANLFLIQDLNNNGIIDSDEFLQSSINSGTIAESITQSLTPGTYFIYVLQGSSNANTSYSLSLAFDQVGNTLATPLDITVDATNRSFSDFVSATGTDTDDFYRFTLATDQTLNLALTTFNQSIGVQLIQDLNGNGVVDSNEVLQAQGTTGTAVISFSRTLAAGTYWLRIVSGEGDANYTITVSTSPIDWLGLNLRDLDLINLARTSLADGQLNRNEVISLLQTTKDGGVITATELADLRLLVSNSQLLGMPDYVRILADRVVNLNPANQFYQGARLGSLLDSGDSATKLELLIGKWFLGRDRPLARSTDGQTTYSYRLASGALFQNGISYTDVQQGDLADCYLLAALAATALRSPDSIQNMFVDNGDGTYTIRFFNNGVADYITVDRYLPTTALGTFAYAGFDTFYNSPGNELWVALIEKAYAQISELGWLGQDNINSYQGIAVGSETIALNQITNRNTTGPKPINFAELVNAFSAGQMVFVDSNPTNVALNIVPGHEYVVVDYNPTTQRVTLFNPWGIGDHLFSGSNRPGLVELSEAELAISFATLSYTAIPAPVA